MSVWRTFSPKTLWLSTLNLTNSLFRRKPDMDCELDTYFSNILQIHDHIRKDIDPMFESQMTVTNDCPIQSIHASLISLEKVLFNTSTEFEISLEGCEKYTDNLRIRLNKTESCQIV